MRKIVLSLLGIVFITEMMKQLLKLGGTYFNYGLIFIGIGMILIYLLHKILSIKMLSYIQLGFMGSNFLLMIALYIYGYVTSVDALGLGIFVIMLFTVLIAQIVVIIFHFMLNKIEKCEHAHQIENMMIIGYTLIFFILNQVSIPANYDIPIETWFLRYGFTFLLFIGISFAITRILKKDFSIVLITSLIALLMILNSGVDANIFLRLPIQIVVLMCLVIKYIPLKSYDKTM